MIDLDILLTGGRIVDVFRQRIFAGWAGIRAGRFVYVEEGAPPASLNAATTLDLGGRLVAPGLIDSHMHIESSLIPPPSFAAAVLPHGTTAMLADAHEVANVAGEEGVRWMMAAAAGLPLHIYHAIPSCVPATSPDLEWTRQVFDAGVVRRLAAEPAVLALGEVMDYGSVLAGNARLHEMVDAALAAGLLVEGHIPTLAGPALSAYLSWRVTSDHTQTTPAKLLEQVAKGVTVMIQAKSCQPDVMAAVAGLPDRSGIVLVTDDVEPSLLCQGHLSSIVRLAVEAGLPPLEALASATHRPARYLGLRDQGGIAPGYQADFLVLDDLLAFPPAEVWVGGRQVAAAGAALPAASGSAAIAMAPDLGPAVATSLPGPLAAEDFRLAPAGLTGRVTANAVALQNTTNSLTDLERVLVTVHDGYAALGQDDTALVAVVARDRSSQSVGLLTHLGLTAGAFASSFAHDSHNLLVAGRDPAEMAAAANAVQRMGGGLVVTEGERVVAALALPIMGLLSAAPVEQVAADLSALEETLRRLGVRHKRPFLILSLLSLSVSPLYKFTDKGVVDTEARRLLPPWEPFEPLEAAK